MCVSKLGHYPNKKKERKSVGPMIETAGKGNQKDTKGINQCSCLPAMNLLTVYQSLDFSGSKY